MNKVTITLSHTYTREELDEYAVGHPRLDDSDWPLTIEDYETLALELAAVEFGSGGNKADVTNADMTVE